MNAYAEEIYELEQVWTATKQLRVTLDTKYEKVNLNKVMENPCQHLTEAQRNELPILLQKIEDLFNGTLGTRKIDLSDFKLKENVKPI